MIFYKELLSLGLDTQRPRPARVDTCESHHFPDKKKDPTQVDACFLLCPLPVCNPSQRIAERMVGNWATELRWLLEAHGQNDHSLWGLR